MENKAKIVIYIFGPERIYDKYMCNEVLNKDNGEWIKLGMTRAAAPEDKPFDVALARCYEITRTGIPETCMIFDVFEFPNLQRKVDDEIRTILGCFNAILSKQVNKEITANKIPAGTEFVYGINRTQIYLAVHAFQSMLITELLKKDTLTPQKDEVLEKMLQNDEKSSLYDSEYDNLQDPISKAPRNFDDSFCKSLISAFDASVQELNPTYKTLTQPYGCQIQLSKNGKVWLTSHYSPRKKQVLVRVGTSDKNLYQETINKYFSEKIFSEKYLENSGDRNPNWFYWCFSKDVTDKPEHHIDWLANVTKEVCDALRPLIDMSEDDLRNREEKYCSQ